MGAESPDLVTAKRLLDDLKLRGFAFRRTAPLIIPGSGLVDRRVEGSALTVLTDVLTWEPKP
ncbi:MAG: hypothetical protein ACRDRW_01820 [Pseudonocardiaceae bacterium]